MLAHVLAHVGPHRQEHALALVVAGAVLVGLAEVADRDRSVDRADDLAEGDGPRLASEHVAAAHAPLGPDEAGTLQREEDLLEVRLGQSGALGDVADRRRTGLLAVEREGQQRPAGVVPPRRHLDHTATVGAVRLGTAVPEVLRPFGAPAAVTS